MAPAIGAQWIVESSSKRSRVELPRLFKKLKQWVKANYLYREPNRGSITKEDKDTE
jgi:hypothetical protein